MADIQDKEFSKTIVLMNRGYNVSDITPIIKVI